MPENQNAAEPLGTFLLNLITDPVFYWGMGAGLVVAVIAALVLWYVRRPPETLSAFDSESGRVTVSRRALQDLIQGCCEQMNDVGRAKAAVSTRGGVLHTNVKLRLNSDGKLGSISGYLQEQITETVKQNLGIESIGNIDIVVVGILPGPRSEAPLGENAGQSKL